MENREQGMFRSHRIDQRRSSYGAVIVIVGLFAVIGWLWFLLASGFLDITTIDPGKSTILDRGEVIKDVGLYLDQLPNRPWHNRNLLMLNTDNLSQALEKQLFVDDVTVEKSYPNILRLKIQERQRSVVIKAENQYFVVDANGTITGLADGSILAAARDCIAAKTFANDVNLPVIILTSDTIQTTSTTVASITETTSSTALGIGTQLTTSDQVRHWLDVFRSLVDAGIKVRFMKIEASESSTARFVSQKGYDIYVDLEKPILGQIKTYQEFMKTKPDENQITQYLDIRVDGKVFIK